MPLLVTLDEKGRIVIPKEAREKLGLKNGNVFVLETKDDATIILKSLKEIADFINDPIWIAIHRPAKSKIPLSKEELEKLEEELWLL